MLETFPELWVLAIENENQLELLAELTKDTQVFECEFALFLLDVTNRYDRR
jgi:hypothetical protein